MGDRGATCKAVLWVGGLEISLSLPLTSTNLPFFVCCRFLMHIEDGYAAPSPLPGGELLGTFASCSSMFVGCAA